MRAKLATFTVALALIAPAAAQAGGWATVGVSPPPDRLGPGDTWQMEIEVLQHGRTPLDGVKPRVIVTGNGEREVFHTSAGGKPGVYRANVVFPSAGTWEYAIDDDFSQTHTFPPVKIGGGDDADVAASGVGASDDGSDLPLAIGIAAIAGIAVALAVVALRRRPKLG
jgi:hypothetical protein